MTEDIFEGLLEHLVLQLTIEAQSKIFSDSKDFEERVRETLNGLVLHPANGV